ncbi:hypothetical protein V5O48_006430 [Marasmius crinis-equi]|uniref:Uncharacterized protein n=1 Tax=Marasmius crinis-equi TaxID=585013 RepID=A0ABR3FJS9_9AGAR
MTHVGDLQGEPPCPADQDIRKAYALCLKKLDQAQYTSELHQKIQRSASSRASRYLQEHIAERDEYSDTHFSLKASEEKVLHLRNELNSLRRVSLQAANILFELIENDQQDLPQLLQTMQRIAGGLTDATRFGDRMAFRREKRIKRLNLEPEPPKKNSWDSWNDDDMTLSPESGPVHAEDDLDIDLFLS